MSGKENFILQLDKMLNEAKSDAAEVVCHAALNMQRLAVHGAGSLPGTPKDTGKAQSNWFLEADGCSGKTSEDTGLRNMQEAQHYIAALIASGKTPRYLCLYNNLPYIRHLEYGLYPNPPKNPTGKTINGFSTQAPQGFFRLALKQFRQAIDQAAEERKRGHQS